MAMNDEWAVGFGKVCGKFGHKRIIERLPYFAVRKNGSMDTSLFIEMVTYMTFDLFPEETITLEIVLDEHGRLVSGPVLWIVDSGPGRLAALSLDDSSWDEAMKELRLQGILIIGLLPNSTSVTAVMDDLFGPFKQRTRTATQKIFAAKVKAHAESVKELKADIQRRKEAGEEVTDKEIRKVNTIVKLDESDVGAIMMGKTVNGYPAPDSAWSLSFTPEKIRHSLEKVCVCIIG